MNFARLDRERGSLTDADEQFVFQATRAIVENINSKQQSSALKTNGSGIAIEESSLLRPKVRILDARPATGLTKWRASCFSNCSIPPVTISSLLPQRNLPRKSSPRRSRKPGLSASLPYSPAGLDQARYLCKRLRSQFPDIKIAVGLWGFQNNLEESRNSLLGRR